MKRRTSRAALLPGFWVVSMVGVLALSDAVDATPPTPATDLNYSVVDGGAVIEGCGGHDCQEGLIIPSTIDTGSETIPVRAIAAEAFVYPDDDGEEPERVIRGDVVIPDSVTVIGDAAFEDQDQITTVTIGDGVVSIGSDAFTGARSLTSLTLGRAVATIGADAFYDTRTLASLVIPDSVISIGDAAFRGSGITSLALGSGLESIGNYGFANNAIGDLVLADSLTTLGGYSFANAGVTSIEFGTSLATIGFGAFSSNQLTTVTLPASIASIQNNAFAYNTNLASFLLEGPVPTGSESIFTSSPHVTEILYRPVHTYPSTWAGKPTRAAARPPGAPTGVIATSGDTAATVTWSAPAVSDAPISAYTVTATPDSQSCTWVSGPLRCQVTGLVNGTTYSFSVVATSTAGTSASSSASNSVVPASAAIPPPPPTTTIAPVTTAPSSSPASGPTEGDMPASATATTLPTVSSPPSDAVASMTTIRRLPVVEPPSVLTVIPGEIISLTGSGFTPGEIVHLVMASTPQILTSGPADETGTVSLTGPVPTDLTPGEHTVALYAPESGQGWRQAVIVSVTLPRTGDTWMLAWWALVVSLIGVATSVVARRTQRRSHRASDSTCTAYR